MASSFSHVGLFKRPYHRVVFSPRAVLNSNFNPGSSAKLHSVLACTGPDSKEMTMHYDIDYTDLDPIAKHNKAIEDIKEYMGEERFNKITTEFRKVPDLSLEHFTHYCSIAGVQGYPVKAWYNLCYGL